MSAGARGELEQQRDARIRVHSRIEDAWLKAADAASLLKQAFKIQGVVHAFSGLGPDEDRYGALERLAERAKSLEDSLDDLLDAMGRESVP